MRILTVAVLGLFAGTAFAQAPDRALALEYLQVARYQQILEASAVEYKKQLISPDAPAQAQAIFTKLMDAAMGWETLREPLIDLVIDTYTKEELVASIAFMKSPAGASATAKSGEFSTRFTTLAAERLKAAIAKIEETAKGPAPVPAPEQ